MTEIPTRFRIRRDTAANWNSANPVLLEAEPALETDTGKVKYGDGTTAWAALPYAASDLTGALLATALDTDPTLAADSDAKVPSQKAVKTALALKLNASALDTDTALAANSDSRIATQKATKAYVDQIVSSQDAMVFKGVIDCSANPNYPAADRGWTYRASVSGKIGGASGVVVQVGDIILCLTDATASGNQATVGSNWSVIQANIDGALTTTDIGVVVQAYSATLTTWAGITPGTGVAAALAINVGSAGAFVVFNGAGGTPSSLTLTNATGLPIAGLVSSTSAVLGVGSLEIGHATDTTLARSSAGNLSIEGNVIYRAGGTDVPVADGGTGASNQADARTNLGLASAATMTGPSGTIVGTSDAQTLSNKTFSGTTLFPDSAITSGARLGIGTPTPDSILVITAPGLGTFRWGYGGASENYFDGDLTVLRSAAGSDRLRVAAGSSGIRFSAYGAGTLVTDSSGNVTASSDSRLKRDVRPFTRGLTDLRTMAGPVLYRWKRETAGPSYAGWLAQDVKKAIPEAVGEDSAGLLTLNDRALLAAAINAILELDARTPPAPGA